MSTKAEGPSSPRQFFARIYGHLEAKKVDGTEKNDEDRTEPKSSFELSSNILLYNRNTLDADNSCNSSNDEVIQVRSSFSCFLLVIVVDVGLLIRRKYQIYSRYYWFTNIFNNFLFFCSNIYVHNLDEIISNYLYWFRNIWIVLFINIYFIIYNQSQKFPYIIYTKIICVKIKFYEIFFFWNDNIKNIKKSK